jgi:hypothetical protein
LNSKIELGQFYTRTNPFEHSRFVEWIRAIPKVSQKKFVEPFAGSNSIIKMMTESFDSVVAESWSAFDIHPEAQEANLVPKVKLQKRDTLANFPEGFDVCITNPPYLAKNSATRKGSQIDFGVYQDLFEIALDRMLNNVPWVAAIIPESFITRDLFTKRLEFVISLNLEMFDDTEFPVCLAVFSPKETEGFEIWRGDTFIGQSQNLQAKVHEKLKDVQPRLFTFNDPNGILGLNAIDGTTNASIRFRRGEEIDSSKIKHTSRSVTRISSRLLDAHPKKLDAVIQRANEILNEYRTETQDVFLTSFKGLRSDHMYRRRLDWNTTSRILGTAISEVIPSAEREVLSSPKLFE